MRLDFIRPLYERPGPYASVYVGGLTARDRSALWTSLCDELERAGGTESEALREEVLSPGPGRAVFAVHGDVVLSEPLPEAPRPLAAFSPLPLVTPMLMQRGERVPHLRVIIDHAGADVSVHGNGSPRKTTVEAEEWPLQKTAQGGFSQRHYEKAVEETWEKNAVAVAQEVDEQVRRTDAQLVLVAGEPHSRSLLCDHLGPRSTGRIQMLERGHRNATGGFEQDVETALGGWLDDRRAELLNRHGEQDGPTGVARVAQALREGRVHALLMPGELPRTVWIGEGATQVSRDAGELRTWGVEHPVQERADSALVRAAAMTDAEIWFTDQVEDVAAVLRY
ncbi:Vms1/Ankzf1 family peptidyl-tRNA hydrolase [Nonomuraea sp. NPDC050478]|uniref:Vms1/Ankzf1 family peptidyl-tRNA hydrolase n=1 Tax=Nonomuraea harbinensis TaxID=1286938 RepID=A0ABW1BZE4_9ACTN|nr:Vms1/Ankzf1 family peptidyl-tRNA hydrolase [Nonomuraea harbinensis]